MAEAEAEILSQRSRIVAEARSWRSTRYRHAADIKHVGVDCSMLIVRVFVDLKLVPAFDPRPYSPTWMLHRSEEEYLRWVFPHAYKVEAPEPGDLVLFKVGRTYSHGGIVTIAAPLTIVHAYKPAGRVVEDRIDRTPMMAERLGSAIYASYFAPKAIARRGDGRSSNALSAKG